MMILLELILVGCLGLLLVGLSQQASTNREDLGAFILKYKRDINDIIESSQSYNAKILNNRKKTVLCNVSLNTTAVAKMGLSKGCRGNSFNFTFLASIQNERLTRLRNLKHLADTLSEFSTCQVSYMKFDIEEQKFSYFTPDDSFYWYENKKLNHTFNPQVYITKDNRLEGKRTLIYECALPVNDVYLSMHPPTARSIHTYPIPDYLVTVAAVHVRLKLLPIENLSINIINKLKSRDDALNPEKIVSSSEASGIIQGDTFIYEAPTEKPAMKSAERYIIYYNGKCRKCEFAMPSEDMDLKSLNPQVSHFVNCMIKPNTCEYQGSCYSNGEITRMITLTEENKDRPIYNAFVCNSRFSQHHLYMPCAINNGNCSETQKCQFNSRTQEINCL